MLGTGNILDVSTKKLIVAVDAFLDFGRYPIFLANDTTFSLNVAPVSYTHLTLPTILLV